MLPHSKIVAIILSTIDTPVITVIIKYNTSTIYSIVPTMDPEMNTHDISYM